MTPRVRNLSFIWLGIALALEYGSTLGGDASKLWGWILLMWTAPFSIIYQFVLYDFVKESLNKTIAQLVGTLFEVGLAYLFWFVVFPKIRRRSGSGIKVPSSKQ